MSTTPPVNPNPIGRLDIQHPHKNSTVSMKSKPQEEETNKYDLSAKPTPFLIAGFNPMEARGRLVSPDLRKNKNEKNITAASNANADHDKEKPHPAIHVDKVEEPPHHDEETIPVTVMPTRLQSNQLSPLNVMLQSRGYGNGGGSGVPLSAGEEYLKVNGRPRSRSHHNVASPRHLTEAPVTVVTAPIVPPPSAKVPDRRATQPAAFQFPVSTQETTNAKPPGGITPIPPVSTAYEPSVEALKSPNSAFEVDWSQAQNTVVHEPTPFDDSDDDDDQLAQSFTNSLNMPPFPPQQPQVSQPTVTTVDANLLDFFTNVPPKPTTNSGDQKIRRHAQQSGTVSANESGIDINRVANAMSEVNRKRNTNAALPAATAPPSLNASRTNSPQITSRHIKEHFQPEAFPRKTESVESEEEEDVSEPHDQDDHKSGKMGLGNTTVNEWSKWAADPDFYFSVHHSDSQTSLGFHKHQVTWRFVLSGRVHELELFHSLFSGKRRLRLNTVEILSEKVPFDGGSSHDIRIGSHRVKLIIYVSGWTKSEFSYQLLIDRIPFERAKRYWVQNVHRAMAIQREQHKLDEEQQHRSRHASRRSSLKN